jgi:hypothetical protein
MATLTATSAVASPAFFLPELTSSRSCAIVTPAPIAAPIPGTAALMPLVADAAIAPSAPAPPSAPSTAALTAALSPAAVLSAAAAAALSPPAVLSAAALAAELSALGAAALPA